MKNKFKIIFSLFSGILAVNLHGQSFSVGELSYTIINDSTVAVCGLNGVEPEIVVVPETVSYENTSYRVTSIGGFTDCKFIKEAILPPTITEIREKAFCYCTNLKRINFPDKLCEIGEFAFYYCSLEGEIEIKGSLDSLKTSVFYGCNIELLTLPSTVKVIDVGALCGNKLREFQVPEEVTEIGMEAFRGNFDLEKIYIPASVVNIHPQAFVDCINMTATIDENNPAYSWEEGMFFNKDKTILWCYPSSSGDIIIPEGTIEIDSGTFAEHKITSVELPTTISKIGSVAFAMCYDLKTLTCKALVPPEVGPSWISDLSISLWAPLNVKIFVPEQSLEAYKTDTGGWQDLKNQIFPIPEAGIEDVNSAEATSYEVFSLDGRQVLKAGTREELQGLERGIYIVNGKKMAL